jgi:hypothetical protein
MFELTKHNRQFLIQYVLIPAISALIGGLISTAIFFPYQKKIEHSYWQKQYDVTVKSKILEKRIELLEQFINLTGDLEGCALKTSIWLGSGQADEEASECYMKKFTELGALNIKIGPYYTDDELGQKMNNFGETTRKLLKLVSGEESEFDAAREIYLEERRQLIELFQRKLTSGLEIK